MRCARLAAWALCAAAGLAIVATGVAAGAVDIAGTWHVLVHYKDAESSKPDQERWEDRLWVIERKGDRLQWADHPIVVFENKEGRFERSAGRHHRVLHHWEPNPAQRAEIVRGLEYNTRGSKQKTLRGSDAGGWTSGSGGGYQSARFLTYVETWSIEDPSGRPVFQRDDTLGGAGAEEFAGRTRYTTTEVREGGNVLVGTFQRDGTRAGSFRLTRSGSAAVVKGSGRTQSERVVDAFWETAGSQFQSASETDEASEAALQQRIQAGTVTEADRKAVRERFEEAVTRLYRDQGNDPRAQRAQIESLVRQIERLYLDEGKSVAEIQTRIRDGRLRP